MKEFSKLFKKTSTGKIQEWRVWVVNNTIHSESGKLGGKMIKSEDVIKVGKNIGKANETSPEEQAELEAESKWIAKKKKGYVETIDDAENDKVSSVVKGGFLPMLAHSFEKRGKDIKFPCAAQPKLDGIRATSNEKGRIWSRTRKEIISVPHITSEILLNDIDSSFEMLDGELYNHDLKDDFEKITKVVSQKKKPSKDHKIVQYHVYDIPSEKPFKERMEDLQKLKMKLLNSLGSEGFIRIVDTVICNNREELDKYMNECLEEGYEGVMVRNLNDEGYDYKRSKNLQKMKEFEDAEFKIVDVEEGRGKLSGHAGSFVCFVDNDGEEVRFNAKLTGKISELKKYLVNKEEYIGKSLTVQFQGYTTKNKVPRFPVALRIREEE